MAEQVFPTKGNLLKLKKSLELAETGYDLMDKKRVVLLRETMQLMERAKNIGRQIHETYAKAYEALQRANIAMGLVDDAALAVPIDHSINISDRSVMGVAIPTVHFAKTELENHYGYRQTDVCLDIAYQKFNEVKKLTAELAEVENAVLRLAEGMSKAQKRANALKNIVIPKLNLQIKEISDSLDEKEREEFSRLKVIKKIVDKV